MLPESVSVPVPFFVRPPLEIAASIVRSEVATEESPIVKVLVALPRSSFPLMLAPLALLVAEKTTLPPSLRVPLPVVTAAVLPEAPPPIVSVVMDWLLPFKSSVPPNMLTAAFEIFPRPLSCSVPAFAPPDVPTVVEPV